jgi:hypothetical protein
MAVATAAGVAVRLRYLARMFPAFAVLRHTARGILPTLPAALVVLGLRWAGASPGPAAEIVIYVALAAAATLVLERALLREALGYLTR